MASKELKELRIVLVGKTGCGKSLTGNTLTGKKSFEASSSSSSKSKECCLRQAEIGDVFLQVVDTPGLFDTEDMREMNDENTKTELVKCVVMSSPGPHAFLIVIAKDRITDEIKNTISTLKELFHGLTFLKHTLVVLTRRSELIEPDSDDLEDEDEALRRFVEASPTLKDLVQNCNGRIIAIENHGSRSQRNEEAKRVIKEVQKLVQENKNEFYSHKVYEVIAKQKEGDKSWSEFREEFAKQTHKIEELERQLNKSWCPIM